MKTLVFTNRKGGVGKTTLAVHAAWYFAETKRTLLIELDTQRNASGTLKDTVADVPLSKLLTGAASIPVLAGPGLVTVAADDEVNNLAADNTAAQQLGANIEAVESQFDVVIFDTSPATNRLNVAALVFATHVVAPINVTQYSIDGIKTLLQQIVGVKQRFNADLDFLGLLPNAFVAGQPSQRRNLQELLATFGDEYMFQGALSVRQAYADATSTRIPAWKQNGTAAREAGREIRGVLAKIDQRMHGAA